MADNERPQQPQQTVKSFMIENRIDALLWLIRLYMIFCTIAYFIPILGAEFAFSALKKVLIGSAAVSALRLHQRMPNIEFNVQFAKNLVLQDSFHYLAYSVLFLFVGGAVSMALVPVFLYAVLHVASYTRKLVNISGTNNALINNVLGKIETPQMQQQLLTFISTAEIMLLFNSVIGIFTGKSSVILPLFYYRFLQLRYSSRRNPYTRLVFSQLRQSLEEMSRHPRCPAIGRTIFAKVIALAIRLAPPSAAP